MRRWFLCDGGRLGVNGNLKFGHTKKLSISLGALLIYLGIKAFNTPPLALEKPLKGAGFFTTLIQTM